MLISMGKTKISIICKTSEMEWNVELGGVGGVYVRCVQGTFDS